MHPAARCSRRSNIPDILPPRAWIGGRLARLAATRHFHHWLFATLGLALGVAALPAVAAAQAREVTTTGFDAQRTNWIRSDVRINHAAIADGSFKFLWKHTFPGEPRQLQSLTQPVLQDFLVGYVGFKSLAFLGGANDQLFAIDTDLAKPVLDLEPDLRRGHRQRPGQYRGAAPAASPRLPAGGRRARRRRSAAVSAAAADAPPARWASRARAPRR